MASQLAVHVSEGALDRGDDRLFDLKTLLWAMSWMGSQGFRTSRFIAGLLLYSIGVKQRPSLRDIGRNSPAFIAALLRTTWIVVTGLKHIIGADRFLSQVGAIAAFQMVSYAVRQARLLQPSLDVLRGNAMIPLLSSLGAGALTDWSETSTRVSSLRLALQRCVSYAEYRHVCAALDNASGMIAWRESDSAGPCGHLDASELRRRIARYTRLETSGDAAALMWALRAELHRRPGGSGSPQLYGVAASGTKKVVEDHVRSVASALDFICDAASDSEIADRMGFFQETRHAFGRTALLLSGGATNGIYHLGVIRALKRVHLLPPIVSGASAGSIVAALLGCKTDEELEPILNDGKFDTRFFRVIDPRLQPGGGGLSPVAASASSPPPPAASGSVMDAFQWLWNAATMYNEQRAVFETDFLADTLQRELGDLTFREAFQRTGRIINIPVAPQRQDDFPRLLNYLTAPHVVVWSASVASCAIPGVFKPVELIAKDDHGNLRPYNSAGHRWTDGSVELDLPMQRLAELFNVNMFVVSQVNPHAALLAVEGPTGRSAPLPLLLRFLKRQGRSFLTSMAELGHGFGLPSITGRGVLPFLTQAYEGDLTLMPDLGLQDFAKLLENPSQDRVKEAIAVGQHMTWPHIPWLRVHCLVEATLDACLRRLRGRLAALVLSGDMREHLALAPTHSALMRSAGPFASAAAFGHGLMSGTSSPELQELAGAEAAGGPPRGLERYAAAASQAMSGSRAIGTGASATATSIVLSLPQQHQQHQHQHQHQHPRSSPPAVVAIASSDAAADPEEDLQGNQPTSPSSSVHQTSSDRALLAASSDRALLAASSDRALLAASSSLASLTSYSGFDSPTETITLERARSAPHDSVPMRDQHSRGTLASPRAAGASGRDAVTRAGQGSQTSPSGGLGGDVSVITASASASSPLGLSRGWQKRGSEARLALLHEMEEDGTSEGARSGSAWSDSASRSPPRGVLARDHGTSSRTQRRHQNMASTSAAATGAIGNLPASSLRAVGLNLPTASTNIGDTEDRAVLVDWSSGHLQGAGNVTGTDSRSSRFTLEPLQEGDSSEG